ncbi:MAG: type I glyceraldehyde-3-phosphate dehydrogenase, partial [Metamycoplasmataceae bacterium]
GGVNIIPTSTGAAAAIGLVLPHLSGKLDGMALRVPVITGSIVDLTFEIEDKDITVEQINKAVEKMASPSLEYVKDPIVSTDVIGSTAGSLYDAALTKIIKDKDGKQMIKVIAWYDNETSYVSQFVRTLGKFSKL